MNVILYLYRYTHSPAYLPTTPFSICSNYPSGTYLPTHRHHRPANFEFWPHTQLRFLVFFFPAPSRLLFDLVSQTSFLFSSLTTRLLFATACYHHHYHHCCSAFTPIVVVAVAVGVVAPHDPTPILTPLSFLTHPCLSPLPPPTTPTPHCRHHPPTPVLTIYAYPYHYQTPNHTPHAPTYKRIPVPSHTHPILH
ncbi:hypothetical protein BDZ94DRAFT_237623 [Collybia nuda]|uniref:Uncharacterized protein n=1 Tax=Collybia nuda TaxID=64659 RepID=A0A9P6CDR5_9AGAR|nr:hypothetical protein BDZ94DRAFT_237623 [Collybia nuda]